MKTADCFRKLLPAVLAALLLAGAATSCASLDKMAEMAEKVKVTCNPEILEAVVPVKEKITFEAYRAKVLCWLVEKEGMTIDEESA